MASVESKCGLFLIPGGPPGCIGNTFAKVEFKCPLATTIGNLKFGKDGKMEALVEGAHGETPGGHTRFS